MMKMKMKKQKMKKEQKNQIINEYPEGKNKEVRGRNIKYRVAENFSELRKNRFRSW